MKHKPRYFASIRGRRRDGMHMVDYYSTGRWPFYHEAHMTMDVSVETLTQELAGFKTRVIAHRSEA